MWKSIKSGIGLLVTSTVGIQLVDLYYTNHNSFLTQVFLGVKVCLII